MMSKVKTCFFIGHREAGPDVWDALVDAVERHIVDYGVDSFTVGRYGRFDGLVSRALTAAKERHPDITLHLLTPYHPYDRPIRLPAGFDSSFYPPGMETVPKCLAIVQANRYMIDNSDYLIAYAWCPGNARELLEYAQMRKKRGLIHVENLADQICPQKKSGL